ncbi:glutamine amidotransferase [Nocardia amikacinitolerans]|uniref:glutamine amidotransferase n=1 Tax=Nocardia amikacinitolerans TaxID=756689 RepID=UPI0020A5B465|nr:glutamine amidotransferase [Nocardia amikacinitolerans]MCP2280443.1 GMP synthase (glutamine-hydrolyzing) [Nocardia amikacinitolerans]MCP2297621.1 GMP synthase (glutamine-hydrolyzing) [Nocardia amikacinitolerans]
MAKPCLLLQLRPERAAADDEYRAILRAGELQADDVVRVKMDEEFPHIDLDDYSAVIVGGGPSNVSSPEDQKYPYQRRFEPRLKKLMIEIVGRDFPYLGACYGLGILADVLGGKVGGDRYGETAGAQTIELADHADEDPLLRDLPRSFRAFVGHKEACQEVPPGATLLAGSSGCPVQMIRTGRHVYATQFHPELDGNGLAIRIEAYRHAGYFAPEEADYLTELGHRESITVPPEILRRFVTRYRVDE